MEKKSEQTAVCYGSFPYGPPDGGDVILKHPNHRC